MKIIYTETAFKVPNWFADMSKDAQKKYLKEHPNSKLALTIKKKMDEKDKAKKTTKDGDGKTKDIKVEDMNLKLKAPAIDRMKTVKKSAQDTLDKKGSPSNFQGPKDKKSSVSGDPAKERKVISLLKKLADLAADAKAKGEKAPNYDLCQVSIPGTNLFCADNKGIARAKMPQLKANPIPGSWADKNLKKDAKGEVDAEKYFKEMLKEKGVALTPKKVDAVSLRATQKELVGTKVAGMLEALKKDPKHEGITAPIFVSKDGYVLDGHHRWAAVVGLGIADGLPDPVAMNVIEIDMEIEELVKTTNDYAEEIGLAAKAAQAKLTVLGSCVPCGQGVCGLDNYFPFSTHIQNSEARKNRQILANLERDGSVITEPNVNLRVAPVVSEDDMEIYLLISQRAKKLFAQKLNNFNAITGFNKTEKLSPQDYFGPSELGLCLEANVGDEEINYRHFAECVFSEMYDLCIKSGFVVAGKNVISTATDTRDTGTFLGETKTCINVIAYNESNVKLCLCFKIYPKIDRIGWNRICLKADLDFSNQIL